MHPATLSAKTTRNGPIAWMLVIPTTTRLMLKFIEGQIGENELLKRTPVGRPYQAVYLCSALVLPEYRGKGIAKRLLTKAIRSMRRDHPIECLFYWAFSKKGGETRALRCTSGEASVDAEDRIG